ncbi:MAG: hypothetical protein N4A33_11085 [Bacteriovoracaceae bacterium]|jgi:flagellar biosynthesis GTPase FlhF|nr:hypothetical protein [Bacteriovoracaceae bacterium]
MYVRTFEGQDLNEALDKVKKTLGPDAIILKTVNNKGISGAFKKARVEITAAISEENYINKAKVDKVLSEEEKESFYKAPAKNVSSKISSYNETSANSNAAGYGNIGLNKVVNTVTKASNKLMGSLDDFLSSPNVIKEEPAASVVNEAYSSFEDDVANSLEDHSESLAAATKKNEADFYENIELKNDVQIQKNKIELLEKRLLELTNKFDQLSEVEVKEEKNALDDLATTLRSMDINSKIVADLVKRASYDLSKEQLKSADTVFEYALQQLNDSIHVKQALFQTSGVGAKPIVTALISDAASAQFSNAIKIATKKTNCRIISFGRSNIANDNFAASIFDISISKAHTISELLTMIRKTISNGESAVIDIKTSGMETDESRKVLETLKRSFEYVDILINVSAINSEIYNRKILSKYKDFSDGVIISYVDQCMSFGSLLNMHLAHNDVPLTFFGTGHIVPDDIETASAERILASMFKL